jgi:hypothetical protein
VAWSVTVFFWQHHYGSFSTTLMFPAMLISPIPASKLLGCDFTFMFLLLVANARRDYVIANVYFDSQLLYQFYDK